MRISKKRSRTFGGLSSERRFFANSRRLAYMHHFDHPNGHINFNSDLSGKVQVVNDQGEELWVSGAMLVNFVATYVENYLLPRMKEAQAHVDIMAGASPDPTTPEEVSRS
jgi:hypothetical protein